MKKLIIVGAGGCGREVLQWAKDINALTHQWDDFAFIDDNLNALDNKISNTKIKSRIENYLPSNEEEFVCSIGNSYIRKKIVDDLTNKGAVFVNIIHPTSIVSETSKIGTSVILYPFSLISDNAIIGDGCIINMYTSVAHDSILGEYCTISAHCDITGMCKLGDNVFMGTSSHMIPSSKIGNNAYICAGSNVMGRVKDNTKVMGNPAKRINI